MRETPQKNLEREKPGLAGKGQVREQEPWMLAKEDGNREREPLLTPRSTAGIRPPPDNGEARGSPHKDLPQVLNPAVCSTNLL